MPPKASEVYRRLLREGWREQESGKGSHRKLRRNGVSITVPYHSRELRVGTWESIKKRAGWR